MAIFYSSVVWTNLWALAIEVNVQESGDKAGQSLWSFIVSVGCCRHAYFMHVSSVMEAWEGLIMLRCFADTSLGYIRDPCCNFIAECYLHNQKVSLKSFIFICHAMHEYILQQEKNENKTIVSMLLLKSKVRMCLPSADPVGCSTVVRNCYAHQYQKGHGPVPDFRLLWS